jgi:hypothetical protein
MLSASELSVRAARKPRRMWIAHMICSGRDCTEEYEAIIDDLDELDRFGCTCGHAYTLLTVSEVELLHT